MKFSNTYVGLGQRFYNKSQPTAVRAPKLFLWNTALANRLNIPAALQQDSEALAQYFSGNQILAGAEPIATAYAGHQFGSFNPLLGDGRAHLLGELLDDEGRRWDLQLKGSGESAYSRAGDGRCALGPAVREFIMSEAMRALGVPTTECLAVVTTGETVYRQRANPGAVVTRVAASHIRVGSFQLFASRGDVESLTALRDYAIDRHFPEIKQQASNHSVALVDSVIAKQIQLVVAWMRVGFIHGVMNTDNTAISGDTIDYGPCAMMGVYDPQAVYSSIDRNGRYAFGNQPRIVNWNMARFAESLLVLHPEDEQLLAQMQELINDFPQRFQQAYNRMMADKLGLQDLQPGDDALIESLLARLAELKLDYTISFDLLTKSLTDSKVQTFISADLGDCYQQWWQRVNAQALSAEQLQAAMRNNNPVVIPRNHHIEAVLADCEASGEASAALDFLAVLRQPYVETEETARYQSTDDSFDQGYQTFCGT
ncbi:YdiU family protein [Dasania sp. GY-MA-18]|uniref:Protein nucleotidyltransferase YdiU n=1 Tax=Dasania phycosphaerae TaxID=2950436 RepID=A0A9J6RM33_9GAMM|nr:MULTISPECIES: YdiU family protein [Dasania]MCR8922615.1 YdiU family protein [Dasania sp. GY-MA-18]MCZ0865045.1 YdiU family protein [Dasania phycosphaerae]MCZ0868771.1 YdiU family protein [Dasania phycosphaerae]